MRIAILASGSGGNAVVVEAGGTRALFDCGVTVRQLERRLGAIGLAATELDALFLSHEHIDHVRGTELLLRRRPLQVLATAGTLAAMPWKPGGAEVLVSGRETAVGELRVTPLATSHDAREPVGFVVRHASVRVGLVTDTGCISAALLEALSGCDILLLEANHDPDMLRFGAYPWPLKQRIASDAGHLSNTQAQVAVERLAHPGLRMVVGMHLSRENNRPELARRELERPLVGGDVRVLAATQDDPLVVSAKDGPRSGGPLAPFDGEPTAASDTS